MRARTLFVSCSVAAHAALFAALAHPAPAPHTRLPPPVEVALLPFRPALRVRAPAARAAASSPRKPLAAPPPPRRTAALYRAARSAPLVRSPPPPAPARPVAVAANEAAPIVTGITLRSAAASSTTSGDAAGNTAATAPSAQAGSGEAPDAPPSVARPADLRRYYPAEAASRGVEGDVVLRLFLDATGALERAELISDPGHGLGEAGLRAIRDFRFRPALRAGRPAAAAVRFTLHFVLH